MYDLIEKIKHGQHELFIYGDGSQVRDFNYVEDAARAAIIAAGKGSLKGEVYNVASGHECSIQELAETLCAIMGVHPKFAYSGAVRPGDAEKWTVDIGRFGTAGLPPQVPLGEGLRQTVDWYTSSHGMTQAPDAMVE